MTIRWERGSRDESVAMGVVALIASGGLDAVTMRAVARTVRMSVGTLGNHYATRENVLATAAREFGDAHVDDIVDRPDRTVGPPKLSDFLTSLESELREQRVWYDLVAAGRSMPHVGHATAAVDARFRDLISYLLRDPTTGARPSSDTLDRFWITLQGLRIEQIQPGTTVSFSAAVAICDDVQAALTSSARRAVSR